MRACAAALLVLALLPQGVCAQEPDPLQAAIAEVDRLRGEGKLREALARATAARTAGVAAVASSSRLSLAEDAVLVAAAAAYARGEECGLYTEEERATGQPPESVARRLFRDVVERLTTVEDVGVREAYLRDPAFERLREVPAARWLFVTSWGRPRLEVWPDLVVDTPTPRFDATIDYALHQELDRPGGPSVVREWLAFEPRGRDATRAAVWAFRWQCALLAPGEHGAVVTLDPLLEQPEVGQLVKELQRAVGDGPWGFDALCLLNPAIAAGEPALARALVERLRLLGGPLYDQGLTSALTVARLRDRKVPWVGDLVTFLEAHLLGTPPPPEPGDERLAPLREGIAELRRLTREERFAEHRTRRQTNEALVSQLKPPQDLLNELTLADLASAAAAGLAYGRGEDTGWLTPEMLRAFHLEGKPPRAVGVALLMEVFVQLSKEPNAEVRHRLVRDPAFAGLLATPFMRQETWSWGRPVREVWPGLRLETGDAEFDRLFRETDMLAPQPGARPASIGGWMSRGARQARTVVDVWTFRWRCALLAPYGEGGWPTRIGLLNDPASVAEALRALEARSGPTPTGFEALLRVNLHIVAGDHDRARELVTGLRAEGGLLYDVAVAKGLTMVQTLRVRGGPDPALDALFEFFAQHVTGLPPEPGPKPEPR